jgi:hypothetical protein
LFCSNKNIACTPHVRIWFKIVLLLIDVNELQKLRKNRWEEGMFSRDAHEEEARFHASLLKRKLQNGVSNGYHSLKVTEASQEPLGRRHDFTRRS